MLSEKDNNIAFRAITGRSLRVQAMKLGETDLYKVDAVRIAGRVAIALGQSA
ncbi:hypothetical protein N9Y42_03175 [Mariniblastus sp.]|nr:hypothetical protein [Mariniblastus sp.]